MLRNLPQKDENMRNNIFKILLTSEKEYCNLLCVLRDVFFKPFYQSQEKKKPIIKPSHFAALFQKNIDPLCSMSENFCTILQSKLNSWNSLTGVSNAFTGLRPVYLGKFQFFLKYNQLKFFSKKIKRIYQSEFRESLRNCK